LYVHAAKIILGNKIDMEDSIKLTEEDLKKYAETIPCPYVLTSAVLDTGIDQAFEKIIENIENYKTAVQGSTLGGKLAKSKGKKKKDCSC